VPAESVPDPVICRQRRTRRIEREVARLAEKQHGVVGRRQLVDIGLSERAVDHRVAMGRLHPVARGVYAVGHKGISQLGRLMAAVLASGPGAVISHRSAAALWGIRDPVGGAVDVTVPHRSTSSTGIRRHLSVLPADEITVCEGIAVTTSPRTIFDLAATSSVDRVEHDIRQLEFLRLYDRLSLLDLIERYPGRRGLRKVQVALARVEALPAGRIRSRLEERFLPFLRRHDLPRPRLNDWITVGEERFQVDCHWSGTGQVVELDSWEAHGTKSAFREDRARDRVLRTAGYDVTRISWAQLDDEPQAVAADLRKLLDRAGARRNSLP
jgi:very-short-patch-repair endonuclease